MASYKTLSGYLIAICGNSNKSALMIFDRHANLKYKYGNRQFWSRGYYVDTAGKNAKAIAEYIRHPSDKDKIQDQITMKNL